MALTVAHPRATVARHKAFPHKSSRPASERRSGPEDAVLTMTEQQQQIPVPAGEQKTTGIRLRGDDVLFFNRQLASMARLNMPIAKGLRVLARDVAEGEFRQLIEQVQQDLDEGRSLQEALSRHPETFTPLHLEVIKAGEATGNLAVILDELNAHTESIQRVKSRILEAVLYPAVISAAIFAFVLFFLIFVAPPFEEMLVKRDVLAGAGDVEVEAGGAISGGGTHLPLVTRAVFALSHLARSPAVLILFLGLLGAGVVFLWRKAVRLGEQYDEFMFRLPLFGVLFERAALTKVTRTMRDLLQNGVSMVETLRLTGNTVGRNRIERKLQELRQAVEEGGSFSRNLGDGNVFPDTMVWKLQLAEEKGNLEDALGEIATEFEMGVDRQTMLISKVLAPVLLLFMGGVVLILFLACALPLTSSVN